MTTIPFVLINMSKSVDRLQRFDARAKALGLAYERFDAIDGRNHDLTEHEDSMFDNLDQYVPGVYGCALSHYYVYKQMIERGESVMTICEDDVFVKDEYMQLKASDIQPNSITFLCHDAPPEITKLTSSTWYDQGSRLYVITLEAAQQIVSCLEQNGMNRAIDVYIIDKWEKVDLYMYHPICGVHRNNESTIDSLNNRRETFPYCIKEGLDMIRRKNYDINQMQSGIKIIERAFSSFASQLNRSYSDAIDVIARESLGTEAILHLATYYGYCHDYEPMDMLFSKISHQPAYMEDGWYLFHQLHSTRIPSTETEEEEVVSQLVTRMDDLLRSKLPQLTNLMKFPSPFWYGYYNTNPRTIMEKFVKITEAVCPRICQNKVLSQGAHEGPLRLGVVSGYTLIPGIDLEDSRIHSSSISDSFYPTLKQLSKKQFTIKYITLGTSHPLFKDPSSTAEHIFIDNRSLTSDEIDRIQNQISELKLDIVLFLDLHMNVLTNMVAMARVAPVQLCTHGHPITSGLPRTVMDGFISWEAAEIPSAQEHYTEKLLLLPKDIVWEYYVPRNSVAEKQSLLNKESWDHSTRETLEFIPEQWRDSAYNWYFCAQADFKYHVRFDHMLYQIQQHDPSGVLILIYRSDAKYQLFNLITKHRKRQESIGIDLNRVVFLNKLHHHDLMAMYDHANVVLDSFFFGGDTTTREAFEVGAPVITLPSHVLGGRWTQAYYHHIGITDLIANDDADYVRLATEVAMNREREKELRQNIRENAHKIFRSEAAIAAWETMLQQAYDECDHQSYKNVSFDTRGTRPSEPITRKQIVPMDVSVELVDGAKGGTEIAIEHIRRKKPKLFETYNVIKDLKDYKTGEKNILWVHDVADDSKYVQLPMRDVDGMVFVSEYQKQLFMNHYLFLQDDEYSTQNVVIPNPIQPFPSHLIDKTKTQYCSFIYHSSPQRGLVLLVDVFSKLVPLFEANNFKVHLHVYSSFSLYDRPDMDILFQALFDKIRQHSHMTYHGTVSNNEVRSALGKAHIFAYPSIFKETSCMCLIEAMSAKCVCVHSSLGALPETSGGKTLMYEFTKDYNEHCTRFAEKLIYAATHYAQINTDQAKHYVDQLHSVDVVASIWERYMTSLESGDAPGATDEPCERELENGDELNIIQTYKTKSIPDMYKPFVDNIQRLHPNCNYQFYTDEGILQFIETKMPQYAETYHRLKYKIQRLDLFRYLAVYYYGGLYLDLDMEIVQEFTNISRDKCMFPVEFEQNTDVYLHKQDMHVLLGNYSFYAPKGHPFIKQIIDNIVSQRIQTEYIPKHEEAYVLYTTGPVLVTQSYIDYSNKEDVQLIKPDPFVPTCFGKYGYHHAFGTWKKNFRSTVVKSDASKSYVCI